MNLVGISILLVGVIITNLLIQYVFIRLGKFDAINERSSHTTRATKTGGIAAFIALFFYTLYFYFSKYDIYDFSLLIPLSIIFITGVYDDFYEADFKLKFLIQIIVAKLFIDAGFIINNYYGFLGFYEIPHLLAQFTTVFVFIIIVNAYNFIDGIDGLAISFAIFVLLTFGFLNTESRLTYLNLICISSLIPLYYFNFKKENKIFLGDAGSLFLGSLIALNVFHFLDPKSKMDLIKGNKVIVTVSILAYPLIDLLRVFIIRVLQKKSPFRPDKNHLHHIVLRITRSHIITTFIIISINLLLLFFIGNFI